MTLRPHQVEAATALRNHAGTRALVSMACGTGKTRVGIQAAIDRNAQLILVVVPSLALVEQTHQSWVEQYREANQRIEALAVCSDPEITGRRTRVTEDSEVIREFILMGSSSQHPRLLISTYQSVGKVIGAYRTGGLPEIDVAIFDEAHHTAGPANKANAVVLDNDKLPVAFRAFLTATPAVHPDGDGAASMISMDDKLLYGDLIHELNFGEAIQLNLLTDYEVAVVVVRDEDIYRDLQKSEVKRDLLATAAQIAIARTMKQLDLVSMIAFHNRVDKSREFTESLRRIGATMNMYITSLHMDGTTPSDVREGLFNVLSTPAVGTHAVLNNCRTMSEGVDIASVDSVAIIDPRTSQREITQIIGRAVRLHPHHQRPAIILLPVYVAPGENPAAVIGDSRFKHVWRVVSTLRDLDSRMDEEIIAARTSLAGATAEGIDLDADEALPERIKIYGTAEADDRFLGALAVQLVERATEDWFHHYGLLEKYARETGRGYPPLTESADSLAKWSANQRHLFNKGRLQPKRVAYLEAIPGWSWNPFLEKREQGRIELDRFVALHGHARVPGNCVTSTGFRLSKFVSYMRYCFRQGALASEEISYFESKPGWVWQVFDAKFTQFLTLLDSYIADHGHALVPQSHKVEVEGKLVAFGSAVSVKRGAYRKGVLPDWQVQALEERTEWVWDTFKAQWDKNLDSIQCWGAEHGHLNIPPDKKIDGSHLYRWLLAQKRLIRNGEMDTERRERLEEILKLYEG